VPDKPLVLTRHAQKKIRRWKVELEDIEATIDSPEHQAPSEENRVDFWRVRRWPAPLVRILTAIILAVVIGTGLIGCDAGHTVTYENQTTHSITLFQNGTRDFAMNPMEKKDSGVLEFTGAVTFEARDEHSKPIYSEALTWDQLKQRGWRIVISETAQTGGLRLPPPPFW
jgi:hypothetical protein